MSIGIAGILVFILALILGLAVPAIIGVYVYRDAKQRNMNPALWTLLAVFAPGFIGLIIYLVARADRTPLVCPNCGYSVNEGFSVCPECGFSLKNKCPRCAMPLEYDWNVCPNCSNPVPQEMKANPPVRVHKDKGIGKILILVILVPLVLCALLIFGVLMFRVTGTPNVGSTVAYNPIEPDYVYCPDIDIEQWCKDCDTNGRDMYYLKAVVEENRKVTTKVLVYRNDGEYFTDLTPPQGSLFKKSSMQIWFNFSRNKGSTLAYFEYTDSREADITFYENDVIRDNPPLTEVSDIIIFSDYVYSYDYLNMEIDIPDSFDKTYGLAVTFYDKNGSADHTIGSSRFFSGVESLGFSYDDLRGCNRFSIALENENGKTIAESGIYDIYDEDDDLNDYFEFYITVRNGKNVILCDDYDAVPLKPVIESESQSE